MEGPGPPSALERRAADVLACDGVGSGHLAAVLHRLDGVDLDGRPVRRRDLSSDRLTVVEGIRCTNGLQTLVDIAPTVTDAIWEQALESALRKRLVSIAQIEDSLPALGRSRVPGTTRIRRVLALRPEGARPTESLLETLMIQLIRDVPRLPDPVRQHEIRVGAFTFRLDISWLDLGLFLELDGQHHADQPVYDASRETAVVAATGWLCGRFTWREVVRVPVTTKRRLAALGDQARCRPLIRG
ncbi:MAG: DUF559 domain-containing protein [Actinomycetota bacterium]|nr:DUF559 domain-containing protein [Actinomycetota bacterium]